MDAGVSPARQARAYHRHELRTLTYVTLDQANGGIVRNLTHEGIGVQAVAALQPRQQVRLRFELRDPRLRVETMGEVMWATRSGQCGIRFFDPPPRTVRQIDEWIFGSLLEFASLHQEKTDAMFGGSKSAAWVLTPVVDAAEEDDGLLVSAAPRKVIELPLRPDPLQPPPGLEPIAEAHRGELDWLSRPLTGRGLTWTINTLVVLAALVLCVLVFLGVAGELPKWPLSMSAGAAIVVGALYWGFFRIFGGASLGARLARLAGSEFEDDDEARDARFR
jgi:hypothetical protein